MKYQINKKKISKFKKNLLIICLSYFCSGLNMIIPAVCRYNPDNTLCKISIFLGIILFFMVPVSFFDDRKEMMGNFYTIMCMFMHLLFSLIASYIFSFWWTMLIYIVEVVISISIIIVKNQFKDKTGDGTMS